MLELLLLLSLADIPVRNSVQSWRGRDARSVPGPGLGHRGGALDLLGRRHGPLALSGALYLGGAAAGSARERRTGVLAAEAYLAGALLTPFVKYGAGRGRPSASRGAHRFEPFSELRFAETPGRRESFPSGHAVAALSVASVVAERYERPWIDALAYGAAVAVGYSRVHQNAHWATDVLAGAALGTAIGKGVCALERRKGWSRRLYVSGNGLALRF